MIANPSSDESFHAGDVVLAERLAPIRLEIPSEKYIDSFFAAMAEFAAAGIPQIPDGMTRDQFPAYIQRLHDQAAGKNLKEGHIPSLEFWVIDSDGYAGRIILGLTYIPTPERLGHHVGYAIRPTKRRQGYATQALRYLLEEAKNRGIHHLMPTCAPANVASHKVIERNGGVLLNPTSDREHPESELRFIIELEPILYRLEIKAML